MRKEVGLTSKLYKFLGFVYLFTKSLKSVQNLSCESPKTTWREGLEYNNCFQT